MFDHADAMPDTRHHTVTGGHHAMDADPAAVAETVLEAWPAPERGIG